MVSKLDVYQASELGERESNEDVHCVKLNIGPDGTAIDYRYANIDYFSICDGHGGDRVSKIVSKLMLPKIMNPKNSFPLKKSDIDRYYGSVSDKLVEKYQSVSNFCGTTMLIIIRYIRKNREYVQAINLGDCRAVLSSDGFGMSLTKDHKPSWPEEKQRIMNINKQLGISELPGMHHIDFYEGDWRVNNLSVSRAFGDLTCKPQISHIPDAFSYILDSRSEFLIMGCDGLWDVMDCQEASNFVCDYLSNNYFRTFEIYRGRRIAVDTDTDVADALAKYAIQLGSMDNVTVIVIVFKRT